MHPYCSLFHQSILPIFTVYGERLPHNEGGTHYAYAQTEHLTDTTEIENNHKDEDYQQSTGEDEQILRLETFELHRSTYAFIDFPTCH